MSYARSLGGISVGTAARVDPVLARASLAASKIILAATNKPASVRKEFVANKLNAMAPGLDEMVKETRRKLIARGKDYDQATFDAMRLGIANVSMSRGIRSLVTQAAVDQGVDVLGDVAPNDRAVGCTIAGTASTVGGVASVIPVYGTIVNLVTGIGSQVAGAALDCGREAREAAQATAQAQANLQAAQAQAQAAAQQQAMMQQQQRSQQLTRVALIGGVGVLALGLIYWVL